MGSLCFYATPSFRAVKAVALILQGFYKFLGENYVGDIAGSTDPVRVSCLCRMVSDRYSEVRSMIQVQRTNDGWVFCVDSMQEVEQFFSEMGLPLVKHTDSVDLWLYGFVNSNPVYLQPLDVIEETVDGDTEWADWR